MRNALYSLTVLTLCSAFLVDCASAQPPAGQRGRGPRRSLRAPISERTSLGLLARAEVQKEIGIRADQKKRLEAMLQKIRQQIQTRFDESLRGVFRLSAAESRKRFLKARQEVAQASAKAEPRLAEVLDEKQFARLRQIRLQSEGMAAFARADVSQNLSLTDDQKKKIQAIRLAERNPSITRVLALMSDQQKATWTKLTGESFRLRPRRFGGFDPRGRRGPGGPGRAAKLKLVDKFDKDKNGWLNTAERKAARAAVKEAQAQGGFRRRRGGRFGRGNREPAKPGPSVSPGDVETFAKASLYDPHVFRTIFLRFDNADWEAELQDFKETDVEVAATLTVDGKTYKNVGVRFRGMSSFMMVPAGRKRSFNISFDMADKKQRLYGYKTLNLLNSNGDPSYLSSVLYSHIGGKYLPVPKSNHVRVVVNGESWGVYVNVQQFDKVFLKEHYKSSKGTRWKVRGNPRADGGLRYLGKELEEYKSRFQMKSNDGVEEWNALVELCRVLNETPLDKLESALEPILDIDETLRFLALDVALVNSDGYWTRASDYSIFRDKAGRFHTIPHDMNEAFHGASGRGRGGPPGDGPPNRGGGPPNRGGGPPNRGGGPPNRGGGFARPSGRPNHGSVDLDPLVNVDNPRMPLRSRLLAVPKLRAKYLEYVRSIARDALDWKDLGPVIAKRSRLIADQVKLDTRKLDSFEAFTQATSTQAKSAEHSIRAFVEKRREFLLKYREPPGK